MKRTVELDSLLTSAEVAALFKVDPKTVTRWALEGKLPCLWTPGGRVRFRPADIEARLNGEGSG